MREFSESWDQPARRRRRCRALDGLRRQHRTAALVEDIDHLLQAGNFGIDHVVGQDDGEWLVADQFLGAEHSVSQARAARFWRT